ncbi:MAG: sulfatase family protein, partial [Puniceicoccales bacterium]
MPTTSNRPNILFLLADQLRWDFVGSYGADFLETPNIDRLAAMGTRYTNAYSAHPLCVPARAALITGTHGYKSGILTNGQWVRPDYPAQGIKTWPERMNESGYSTAAIGKMHFYPWMERMGFEFKCATEDKRWPFIRDDYHHYLHERGSRKYVGLEHEQYEETKGAVFSINPWELSWDHFVGQEAVSYLEKYDEDNPFSMMVGFTGPHCPYDPNKEFIENIDLEKIPPAEEGVAEDCTETKAANIAGNRRKWNGVDISDWTPEQKKKVRQHYAGLVQQIDLEVGCILDTLEKKGLLENTLIIFTSDHGDYLGDHGMAGKGTFYEGSCHIPMIISDPSNREASVCEKQVELTDVTATMLTYAGCGIPEYMDSIPLPGLPYNGEGRPDVPERDGILGAVSDGCMFLKGDWKYAKYATGEMTLFNLAEDPNEVNNRIDDPAYHEVAIRYESELSRRMLKLVFAG